MLDVPAARVPPLPRNSGLALYSEKLDEGPIIVRARADDLGGTEFAGRSNAAMRTKTITSKSSPGDQGNQELDQVRDRIAINEYEVDARQVAEAIIAKLRLVQRGHVALAARQAGRSRRVTEMPHGHR